MTIKFVSFTGETPPYMLSNSIVALEQLNEWRNRNPDVRLISIETKQRVPVRSEPGDEYIEPLFDLLLVWYEE